MTGVIHTVGTWRHLMARTVNTDPRALCGASLTSDTPAGDPGPDAPPCPECAARNARFANRSWNAAFAAIVVCAAAFVASVIASAYGWHPAFTGPAAGACALALVASGVWLHLAAARLEPLDPDDNEEPQP